MRDLVSRITPVLAINPAVLAATPSAVTVDRRGFDSQSFLISYGAGGITFDATNRIDFVMTHSDDGTTYTAVTAADLIGADAPATVTNGIVLSLNSAVAAPTIKEIGYVGNKRYTRLVPTFAGTHGTGTAIQATVVLGNAFSAP